MPLKSNKNGAIAIVLDIDEILCITPTGLPGDRMCRLVFKNQVVVIVPEYVEVLWNALTIK